jgi:hypothetical protein
MSPRTGRKLQCRAAPGSARLDSSQHVNLAAVGACLPHLDGSAPSYVVHLAEPADVIPAREQGSDYSRDAQHEHDSLHGTPPILVRGSLSSPILRSGDRSS